MTTVKKDDPRIVGNAPGKPTGIPVREPDPVLEQLKEITARLDEIEKLVAQSQQYQKDHDELHRNMAAAHGKEGDEVKQSFNETRKAFEETIEKIVGREPDITPPTPTPQFEPEEPSPKRYKIVRNQNGLIDSIEEKPA